MAEIKGVFNFDETFPGPHMIRVRLERSQAWEVLRLLVVRLRDTESKIDFAWFGTLTRDIEEDAGNPIEASAATTEPKHQHEPEST